MKKILLTGGGSAGHVTPNFALIDELTKNNIEIFYIGSKNGIEKQLVALEGLPYIGISSGKLRRYFDLKNFTDPFRILGGFFQAIKALGHIKPDLVFSKGGFVTVPVVFAAWFRRIPIVTHESDMTPGLANKLTKPFAKKILCTFEETLPYLPQKKGIHTGTPIRETLADGNLEEGYTFTHFTKSKPVLMMMGGSLGSLKLNKALRDALPELLHTFQVVHLCGKGNLDHSLDSLKDYRQYEYIGTELKDLFKITEIMISRAGSNAINEFAYLNIPSLLIPLSKNASRGDQILNARAFEKKGYSYVIEEEDLTKSTLLNGIHNLHSQSSSIRSLLRTSNEGNGTSNVVRELLDLMK